MRDGSGPEAGGGIESPGLGSCSHCLKNYTVLGSVASSLVYGTRDTSFRVEVQRQRASYLIHFHYTQQCRV